MPDPKFIDSLRFAQAGLSLSGEYMVTDLARLKDLLVSDAGNVAYRLEGVNAAGRPALRLSVRAELAMLCQRCLEPFVHRVEAESLMPQARNERELAAWERDDPLLDAQVCDARLDVRTLVEDEILLSLPIMPRHAEGECGLEGESSPRAG